MSATTRTEPYWSVEQLSAMAEHVSYVVRIAEDVSRTAAYLLASNPEWTGDLFGPVYGVDELAAAADSWRKAAVRATTLLAGMVGTYEDGTYRHLHEEASKDQYLHEGFARLSALTPVFVDGQLARYSIHT